MSKSHDQKVVINLEKIELKVLKQILGVNQKAANLAIYGEFGRMPLRVKIFTKIVKYMHRRKLGRKNQNVSGLYQATKD